MVLERLKKEGYEEEKAYEAILKSLPEYVENVKKAIEKVYEKSKKILEELK